MSVTVNGTSGIVFNDSTTQGTSAFYGGLAFRNRIINGAMVIDQRNAGALITLATGVQAYPVDRFPAYKGTSGATVTAQQSSTAPAGFVNSIVFTASTGATPAVTDANGVWQVIEGNNVADLGWGTANAQAVTISFWVRSSVTGTYSVSLTNSAVNRFYVATYTVNAANTWEQKTITVAGDTSGTWLTNNGFGIQIVWDLGYGTNFNGSAGAWGSSTIRRTSGSVQFVATTGATFYITGVQLEKGSTATSFDYRPYGTELQLCQRYFQMYSGASITNGFGSGRQTTTTSSRIWINFPSMRATPTFAYSGTVYLDAPAGVGTISSVTLQDLGLSSGFCDVAHSAIGAIGYGCGLQIPSGSNSITLSVEL